MKRALKRSKRSIWYYDNEERVEGVPPDVQGNLAGVQGDLTGVRGNLTGVWGYLTGVWGYLTACELTDEDRERGVHISELIEEDAQ